ncbi:hypothetical protein LDG_7304 [Legionella drancourtii LLAP12]|uniref:Uncharacterized protein n=1 Tax=Legionella drancourtii LLAP12 TaxID=658187 RepID=G9EPW3_9GAMM|nr:hypothetical protein LDG_7304 [Legionella drancourtii LLAP12]
MLFYAPHGQILFFLPFFVNPLFLKMIYSNMEIFDNNPKEML